jgi:putative inorganic carbon (HCO3(-)) transporter
MRDYVLATFLFGSLPFILWRPTLGVFLWIWVSTMNPHRLMWDFAIDMRWAYYIAAATLVGLVWSRVPRRLPITPITVVLFLMVLWTTVTTMFAMDRDVSLEPWKQVIKIQLMVFVSMYLLNSKQHANVLIWVLAVSVGFYGVKGGLFTLWVGGEYRVWGPKESFIEDNNALALATIMTIPLLYYLFLQATKHWVRWGLLVAMVLCGLSALGSQSRGGFLAILAMLSFLWLKSRSKAATGLVLAVLVPVAIGFMPQKWMDRMETIEKYEQDGSAMSRINSWTTATNLAKDRFTGGGFRSHYAHGFASYAEDPSGIRPAHSIYFEMLGEHGFIGLALFLLLWVLVWREASWVIRQSKGEEALHWASDLARMIQVSLLGYFVGGAFLNLAQYDLPYNLVVALVLTRGLVEKQIQGVRHHSAETPIIPTKPLVNGGHATPDLADR